jgi:hypothetical protein
VLLLSTGRPVALKTKCLGVVALPLLDAAVVPHPAAINAIVVTITPKPQGFTRVRMFAFIAGRSSLVDFVAAWFVSDSGASVELLAGGPRA